ncbi:MAG: hypothetical protein COB98_10090, partial [Flavobacteriaceae bacterium]
MLFKGYKTIIISSNVSCEHWKKYLNFIKMKKITKIGSLMASLFFILSCGGGGGEEVEEVFAVSGEVTITDAEYWSAQEEIRFGVFKPGKMNPFSSVKLTKTSDGKASFYVKDIVAGTYEFKIYVAKNGMNTVDL